MKLEDGVVSMGGAEDVQERTHLLMILYSSMPVSAVMRTLQPASRAPFRTCAQPLSAWHGKAQDREAQ